MKRWVSEFLLKITKNREIVIQGFHHTCTRVMDTSHNYYMNRRSALRALKNRKLHCEVRYVYWKIPNLDANQEDSSTFLWIYGQAKELLAFLSQ